MSCPTRSTRLPVPRVVIDTNSVLDLLLFQDAGMQALAAAVQRGHVDWLVCQRMRDEFERTLGSAALTKWQPDPAQLLAAFDAHASMQPDPPTLPALRCSDPDDQVFLELALATSAHWLISHDRALLRLAKRAARTGLLIVKPQQWSLLSAAHADAKAQADRA